MLLSAWEEVRRVPPQGRAAALLRAFGRPAGGSLGAIQGELLSLYAQWFGARLDGLAHCPGCSAVVELSVPIAELTASVPDPVPVEPFVVDGQPVHWRLPTESDLAAIAGAPTPSEAAQLLASRCVVEGPVLREELAARIAAADPYADITFDLTCPECDARWESTLDIAEFVWAQLNAQARRLLGEVDELARAYGWSERDILGLSQDRRDAYLELVRHG